MRWRSRLSLKKRLGNGRGVYKFLWWPTQIGDSDWRWLEMAYINEVVTHFPPRLDPESGLVLKKEYYAWAPVSFVEEYQNTSR